MTTIDGYLAGLTFSFGFFITLLAIYILQSSDPWLVAIPLVIAMFVAFILSAYSQLSITGITVAFAIGSILGLGLMYESQVAPMQWIVSGN